MLVKLKIYRVIEVEKAITLIGNNVHLRGEIAFKLGLLCRDCRVLIKQFNLEREAIVVEARKKTKEATEEKINQIAQELENNLLTLDNREIEVNTFSVQEFIATRDIIDVFRENGIVKSRVVFKQGQTVVPVSFFTLMGDVIKEN